MNYLTEHGLLEYSDLVDRTETVTAGYNDLSAKIKELENKLTEIRNLRTHIINYSKTREVYVAYRKSGYSKKFLAEHESEILLHKAAKNAFNKLDIKKLPTVKSLQMEYTQLADEKKKLYTEYKQSRAAMREILTVKANVDRLIGTELQEIERERNQSQR